MEIRPPHSLDVENSLLACCLLAGISPPCNPDDFAGEKNQLVAKAMMELELSGVTPDLLTVGGRFKPESGMASYLAGIFECAGTETNLETYSEIVRSYAAVRRAQIRAVNFATTCNDYRWSSTVDPLSGFCADILAMADTKRSASDISAQQAIKCFLSKLDNRMSTKNEVLGIATGVSELDRMTCGLNPQDLIVLAARPSMGKTALAIQIAKFAASKGERVDIFSLEMPADSITQRMVANQSKVALSGIRTGRLDPKEYTKIAEASNLLSSLDYRIVDNPCTELDIIRRVRKRKPSLVVVDYLQLVIPSRRSGNPNQDIGGIATIMKNLAKEMNIPVILLSQLTRKNDQDNREPKLSDLRDSGQIEQDADAVLFIHAKDGDHKQPQRKFILAKNRQGECCVWDMVFQLAFQRFEREWKS